MFANQLETNDAGWDDEWDGAFFRLVWDLFTAEIVYSAGVLLATYDGDDVDTTAVRTAPRPTRSIAETATPRVHS